MAKRTPNHRLVKIHRSYTVEEIANRLGTRKNTVRRWVKEGLPILDNKRPMLILGQDLASFLKARRAKNKQTCKPGELYCVRCRSPKLPAGRMAEFSPVTEKYGNLIAICPDCHAIMNRRVSLCRIGEFEEKVDVSFPEVLRRLNKSTQPTVDSDLEGGTLNHGKAQCCQ